MNENKTDETAAVNETGDGKENSSSFLKSAAEKLLGLSRKGKKRGPAPAPDVTAPAPEEHSSPAPRPDSPAAAAAPADTEGDTTGARPESPGGRGKSRSRGRRRKSAGQRQAAARTKEGGEQPPAQAQEEKAAPEKEGPEAAAPPKSGARKGRKRTRKPAAKKTEPPQAEQEAEVQAEAAVPALKLLINSDEPEECRIVLLENGKVESLHIETVSRESTKGNIYKGRITAVEPNLQAAFVDIGTIKNGFLPFSEIHPEYYSKEVDESKQWKDLAIQEVITKGQEVLVQVVKEATGGKGANMTTYLSMPGRNLVLMPGSDSAGISRKIEDEAQRARLREMVSTLKLPEGIGYIIRTASADITKTALATDAKYLVNLWDEIKKRGQTLPTPSLIYKEQNIISRFLRDHFTSEIAEIVTDTQEAFDQVQHFLLLLPPKQRTAKVRLHHGSQPLFSQYRVEEQIEQIYQAKVPLPSGGSIVINPTEALVAIDVNSGRTAKDKNFEETIFLANMEAADELARQLRLRDLGGLIVVDFIDMREQKHIREVEKQVKTGMKRDKAKVDFSRISKFGLMQISRQKMASPIQMGSYITCEHCQGRGMVRSVETQVLVCLRQIHIGLTRKQVQRVECRLPSKVAHYLLNKKREDLLELERQYTVQILIEADPAMAPDDKQIDFVKG